MPFWERAAVAGGVILAAAALAKLIDRRMARRSMPAEAVTRYRVLRRGVMAAVVALGILSALLVIPQVRAVAGGILASSAIVGLVLGFASRSTLANFVAGLLIAITQPVRLGDFVEFEGSIGTVEEIGLTYTFIRTPNGERLVVPNERLASDTIRNSTIVSREKLAEIDVTVGLDKDLRAAVDLLRDVVAGRPGSRVLVTALGDAATITLHAEAPDAVAAEELASALRVDAHERLRSAGLVG